MHLAVDLCNILYCSSIAGIVYGSFKLPLSMEGTAIKQYIKSRMWLSSSISYLIALCCRWTSEVHLSGVHKNGNRVLLWLHVCLWRSIIQQSITRHFQWQYAAIYSAGKIWKCEYFWYFNQVQKMPCRYLILKIISFLWQSSCLLNFFEKKQLA